VPQLSPVRPPATDTQPPAGSVPDQLGEWLRALPLVTKIWNCQGITNLSGKVRDRGS